MNTSTAEGRKRKRGMPVGTSAEGGSESPWAETSAATETVERRRAGESQPEKMEDSAGEKSLTNPRKGR